MVCTEQQDAIYTVWSLVSFTYVPLFSVTAMRLRWCTSGMATCPRTTFLNRSSLKSLFLAVVVLVSDCLKRRQDGNFVFYRHLHLQESDWEQTKRNLNWFSVLLPNETVGVAFEERDFLSSVPPHSLPHPTWIGRIKCRAIHLSGVSCQTWIGFILMNALMRAALWTLYKSEQLTDSK